MTDREKLVDMLYNLHRKTIPSMGEIADHILADEEIKHAFELLKAEKEGRLFETPCKVGGKVYIITRNKVKECEVMFVSISADEKFSQFIYVEYYADGTFYKSYAAYFDEIGKTVFLSREEAEKALKGVE